MVKFQGFVTWMKVATVAIFTPWKSANAIHPHPPLIKRYQHTCLSPSAL